MADPSCPVRIVIADDHAMFRDGLRLVLNCEPDFKVVGEASDGLAAVQRVNELDPDVVLLDLAMPRSGRLEALRALRDRRLAVRPILFTAHIERANIVQVLQLGVRGIILKDITTDVLFKCIRAVMRDQYWIGHGWLPDIIEFLRTGTAAPQVAPPRNVALTRREVQIIAAIVDGAPNKDIGLQFGVSRQTVKNHLSRIFGKVGVSNRLELARHAMARRLAG